MRRRMRPGCDPDAVERSVVGADAVAAQVQAAWPEGIVVERTFLGGLLTSPTSSAGVMITAIQPELESQVSDWQDKVDEGAWLEPDDTRGILLGVKLAEALDVSVGKKVVLMGQGKDEVNSKLLRVRGFLKTGAAQMDGSLALVTVGAAQDFLDQPDAVSQISLHVSQSKDSEAALVAVRSALGARSGIEVLGWKEAVEEVYEFTQTDKRTNNSIFFIIGLITALGIVNTVLMSVMERVREFGVMLALGTSPARLRLLILTEGLLIGLIGAALGLGAGSALTSYLVEHGIDYSEMLGGESIDMAGVAVDTFIKAAWDWPTMAVYCGVAVLLSVLATVYPAWKVGALRPVESMRHV